MRARMVRGLGVVMALSLWAVIGGPATAADASRFAGNLPVGLTYEVHVKQVFHGTVHVGRRSRPRATRLTESYRVTVLALTRGRPSKVRVNYLGAEATPHTYRLERRAAGHTYVVTARPGKVRAKVTENGDPVDAMMAHRVRGDALAVMAPEALDRAVARGIDSPGHAVDVPPKLINAALGAAGPQVIAAHLKLVRVNGGRALFMLSEHNRWMVGAVTVDGSVSGPEVLDADTGRALWARLSGTLSGHGYYLTRHHKAKARVTGRYSTSVQFDYDVK